MRYRSIKKKSEPKDWYSSYLRSMSLTCIAILTLAQANTWKTPITFLPPPTSPDEYVRELGTAPQKIKLEGDTLTILVKGTGDKMFLLGTVDFPLRRLEGTDVWIAQAKYPHWDKAFFSFSISTSPEWKAGAQPTFWYGIKAPKKLPTAKNLRGKLLDEIVPSKSHGADRKVTVYLPPDPKPGLPALYITDGESCRSYAQYLEPLILAKKVKPIAVIGVHNGKYQGTGKDYDFEQDFRAREYLKVFKKEDYAKHVTFFCDEVTRWAEAKFNLGTRREDRAISGFSNGGAFTLTTSTERPEVFAHSIPMSVAAMDHADFKKTIPTDKAPSYYFAAGTLEPFIANTQKAHLALKEANAHSQLIIYETGHEFEMWALHSMTMLQRIFPANP